jgi:hypothetical protein
MGDPSVLDFGSTTHPLTITAWAYPTSTSLDYPVIAGMVNAYGNGSYVLRYETGGNLAFWMSTTVSNNVAPSTSTYPTNNWYFVVGTYNGSKITLYVDGTPIQSTTVTGAILNGANPEFWIGADCTDGACRFFNGTIEDVRVYNTALSAPAIAALYQSSVPNFEH